MHQESNTSAEMATPGKEETSHIEINVGSIVHMMMAIIMALAITAALTPFLGVVMSVPLGIGLVYVFDRAVMCALGIGGEASKTTARLASGIVATAIAGATIGLSSSTLYRIFFAEASMTAHLNREYDNARAQVGQVVSESQSAVRALRAWETASADKAKLEATMGGTCPSRPHTSGRVGPVTLFRRDEADLARELTATVNQTIAAITTVSSQLPARAGTNVNDATKSVLEANKVINAMNAATSGSAIRSTIDAIVRREAALIQGTESSFQCGDTSRLEQMATAKSALEKIKGRQTIPAIAIQFDIKNPGEIALTGLTRSFNSILAIASFGQLKVKSDPLMEIALKERGLLNTETLPMLLASILEIGVILSGAFSNRHQGGAGGLYPALAIQARTLQSNLAQKPELSWRIVAALLRLFLTVFTTRQVERERFLRVDRDPSVVVEAREFDQYLLQTGAGLAKHHILVDLVDLLLVPTSDKESLTAVKTLEYAGVVSVINVQVGAQDVLRLPSFRASPEFRRDVTYVLAQINADFAHALRVFSPKRDSMGRPQLELVRA